MRSWFTPRIVLPTSAFSSTMSSRAAQRAQRAQQVKQWVQQAQQANNKGDTASAACSSGLQDRTELARPLALTGAGRHAALGLVVIAVSEPGVINGGDGPRLLPACKKRTGNMGKLS